MASARQVPGSVRPTCGTVCARGACRRSRARCGLRARRRGVPRARRAVGARPVRVGGLRGGHRARAGACARSRPRSRSAGGSAARRLRGRRARRVRARRGAAPRGACAVRRAALHPGARARPRDAVLPRERRVLRDAPVEDVLEALTGAAAIGATTCSRCCPGASSGAPVARASGRRNARGLAGAWTSARDERLACGATAPRGACWRAGATRLAGGIAWTVSYEDFGVGFPARSASGRRRRRRRVRRPSPSLTLQCRSSR